MSAGKEASGGLKSARRDQSGGGKRDEPIRCQGFHGNRRLCVFSRDITSACADSKEMEGVRWREQQTPGMFVELVCGMQNPPDGGEWLLHPGNMLG